MGKKNISKYILDICMSVMLLFLMAYQVTGEKAHEWLGIAMFVLIMAHNLLNVKWYASVFRGHYTLLRISRVVVNILMLIAMLATMVSGILLNSYVFPIEIHGTMATARVLHLAGSYWSFVLMSIHLGQHWSIAMGLAGKKVREKSVRSVIAIILRLFALALAIYGGYRFISADILTYMTFQTHFAFLDYERLPALVIYDQLAMMGFWVFLSYYFTRIVQYYSNPPKLGKSARRVIMKKVSVFIMVISVLLSLSACGNSSQDLTDTSLSESGLSDETTVSEEENITENQNISATVNNPIILPEDFVTISGGTFLMGSPETENWRGNDETQHEVTISDFAMCIHEVTQSEYEEIIGNNPSSFVGENLPVDSVSWLEAVNYCNLRSVAEGLTPAYQIDGETVTWNRSANGYRLPTEAEWEYACRAGTTTPFNTETSISADEANYYGHYPYEIEENYFSQGNLETQPGIYRQTTVAVMGFSPNAWGLYDMHGNVGEWVWDYYGSYSDGTDTDPTGPENGTLRVNRGGGWNDFAKNMRSAYRAAAPQDQQRFNVGLRLVLGALPDGSAVSVNTENDSSSGGEILIAYFSWSGNTRGIAEEIARQTGADLFEIECVTPYSTNYNTVLEQAQNDQHIQARPELATHVENMDQYDIIILGYPNWWASIPMPIASFLEEYDFSGKTIMPFCSHGGGRFGQSLTAIAKLVPDATLGEGLSVHYSGGSSLPQDVTDWLETNQIPLAE